MSFFRSSPDSDDDAHPAAPSEDAGTRPTWIGQDLRVKGEMNAEGNIFVQGSITGTIESKGQVVVQSSGRVQADISAKRIEVHGTVIGDLCASEAVVLGAEARMSGNIDTPSLTVSPGATFHGMTGASEKGTDSGGSA